MAGGEGRAAGGAPGGPAAARARGPPRGVPPAERIFCDDTVCAIVTDGVKPPAILVEAAEKTGIALLASPEPSQHVINVLRPYMQQELGEVSTLHGVMLDVLEIGVLITGECGT